MSPIWLRCVMASHKPMINTVKGTVKAQYIQNLSPTTSSLSQFKDGTANSVAKNVPGKNIIVITAITFIDELSILAALVSSMLARVS